MKRFFDFSAAVLLCLLFAPIMLALAMLVRLSSPGPAFFRQVRVGKDGQPFELFKFRSMRAATGGPSVTADGDRRITPIGKLLRKSKLDELPQLFNVLKGEMSLVGPRPEVPQYVQYYTPEQRLALSVRPGITGLTQVEFRHEEQLLAGRDDVEAFYIREVMPAKLAIDLRYVRERTFFGDLRILLQTLCALFRRD